MTYCNHKSHFIMLSPMVLLMPLLVSCFFVATLFPLLEVVSVESPPPLRVPGPPACPKRCGEVDIPYPFGIGRECAMEGFALSCIRTRRGAYKPFLTNVEVLSISLPDGKARMKNHISWQCYNISTGKVDHDYWWLNLSSTPYRFSNAENKFTVIGCSTCAFIEGESWSKYTSGCISMCNSLSDITNGSCSGTGCCQTAIPEDMSYYQVSFENCNTAAIWNFSRCSYAVLMEADAFDFSSKYVTTDELKNSEVPISIDWAIRNTTCKTARSNATSYACRDHNSKCVDSKNGPGYFCNCSRGYQGNPYLLDRCKDIDECALLEKKCFGECKNTPGGYECWCPRGARGNPHIKDGCFKSSLGLSVGIGVGSGAGVLFMVLGASFVTHKLKRRRAKKLRQQLFKQNRGHLLQQLVSQRADISERMIFPLEELEMATNKFDEARELGGGGHGTVYKGILSDLHVVAIKKSKVAIQREIDEFINEVAILSQINHRNVVKLFGCCLETKVPLLVYEFISNGTLYQHLHVEGPISLAWKDRLRIAIETARALAYLHSAVAFPIIHRDIKSHNILLDGTLTTKVSDFGASRCVPVDQTGITTAIQGTLGYLDPMYYYTGRLTEKSDVYSFGVVLIELLTRKKPYSYRSPKEDSLVAHFTALLVEGNLFHILDPQVVQEGGKEIEEVAALAAVCVRLEGGGRPTMRQVEMRLESLQASQENVVLRGVGSETSEENRIAQRSARNEGRNREETSRQYSLEEEFLLSASYAR